MKKALIIIAPGFEEIEALGTVDILRRAGIDATLSGTKKGVIEGRSRIRVESDADLVDCVQSDYDLIVLPGGLEGVDNLKKDPFVKEILLRHYKKKRLIGAICAGTTVLAAFNLIAERIVTSHPSVRKEFIPEKYSEERVVIDGNIVTSRSPGTALEFAFALIAQLLDEHAVREVNKGVLALGVDILN